MKSISPSRYEMPRIGVDRSRIWVEYGPQAEASFPWAEITRIVAGKIDGVIEVERVIEIEHESGHFLEFNERWPGFETAEAYFCSSLEGVFPEWVSMLDDARLEDTVVIWER